MVREMCDNIKENDKNHCTKMWIYKYVRLSFMLHLTNYLVYMIIFKYVSHDDK